jgi:hypothetical protein
MLAQTTNNQSISGTVQDSSGAVVPSATVTVVSEGTALTRSAVSSESGAYFISNVPIGFYELSATAPGFKKFLVSHVEVTVEWSSMCMTRRVKQQAGSRIEHPSEQSPAVDSPHEAPPG